MKKIRKITAVFLSALMILPLFSFGGITAFADETDVLSSLTYEFSTGMFTYGMHITDCDTSLSGDIVLPDTIDGEPVKYIDSNAFIGCHNITSITVPDTVKTISKNAFSGCNNLKRISVGSGVTSMSYDAFGKSVERIDVSENNTKFSSDRFGVVYNKAKTELKIYPEGCRLTEYTIPATVTKIDNSFTTGRVKFNGNLMFISVDENNTVFFGDEYGVLFNKDKTELIKCPVNFSYTSYSIPDGVLTATANAFSSCKNLEKITVGKDITSVSNYMFSGCKKLSSVQFFDKVASIGDSAFSGCTSLTEINLPENLQSIGISAFNGCSALTSVHLPESVTEIKDYTFENCTSLTEVTMGKNVTAIGRYSFNGCKALEEIELPEGIKSIPDYAFYYCNALESVSIPDSVETIGMAAFQGCSIKELTLPENLTEFGLYYTFSRNDFTSVDIPDGVSEITNYCFSGCDKLKDVYIPQGVTSIAESAFISCSSIEELIIPASVESIGERAFSNCTGMKDLSILNPDCVIYDNQYTISENAVIHGHPGSTAEEYATKYNRKFVALDSNNYEVFENFTYEVVDGAVTIIFCDTEATGEIIIPESIGEYPVTAIGEGAFDGCVNVSAVTFNSTDIIIFDSETTIPANIAINGYVGSTAESYATKYNRDFVSLNELAVLKYLKYSIKDGKATITGFENTISGHIVIPDTIEGCPVTAIKSSAFFECATLTGIVVPDSVTSIGGYAFRNCKSLESVVLPENLAVIDKQTFLGCSALKSINFPEGLTLIGEYSFSGCISLKSINIPGSVKSIGVRAFDSCQNLSSIVLNEGLQEIGAEAFYNAYALTEIVIPDSVTKIGASAFSLNRALTKAVIGKGLTDLGDKAFRYCGSIENFIVDEENEYFSSDKYGVLFNKNKTRLMIYPSNSSRQSYKIPDTVTELDTYAFYNTGNLVNVILPDGIKIVSSKLFYGSRIEEIIIPEGVETIGQESFSSCYYLKNIQIPESVTSIEKDAFAYCNKIADLKIPNSECTIYDSENTIYSKTAIIGYPDSTAEAYATKYNRQFISVIVTGESEGFSYKVVDDVLTITECDRNAEGNILIPEEIDGYPVTGISPEAFSGRVFITEIILPSSIKNIDNNTFSGCRGLKKVVATGVEEIGEYAFEGCPSLDTVVTFADSFSVAENAFPVNERLIVFVPENAVINVPETLNVITFSFSDGTLNFTGEYKSDLYYLFDLVAVMCAFYEGIEYLSFDSFEVVSADEGRIYYYTYNWERIALDGSKITDVIFTVEAFDGEEFRKFSFNELCEYVASNAIDNFNLVVEEADGLERGCVEISLVDHISITIKRILKALTNLINKLFSFFKKFGK